jgi:hypothetical protein
MHIRAITITRTLDLYGISADLDETITYSSETLVSELSAQHGYRGATVTVCQWQGVVGLLSLWSTTTALKGTDSIIHKTHKKGPLADAAVRVQDYEQLLADGYDDPDDPVVGPFVTATTFRIPPANTRAALDEYRSAVLPRMQAYRGYRALRVMAHRKSGHGMVWAVWSDRGAMEMGTADVISRRGDAAKLDISFGEVSFREIVDDAA